MAIFRISFGLLALLGLVEAIAIPPQHEVHEKRGTLHPRWTKRDRVEPHKLLPMRVGLTQTNLENGYDYLMDV
jgi:tripeptidyl-peptidase-1